MVSMAKLRIKIFVLLSFLVFLPVRGDALSVGESKNFFVEPSYDNYDRSVVEAEVVKITNEMIVYAEKDWWNELNSDNRNKLDERFYNLSVEFERKIYPQVKELFGEIPNHPVDKSGRLSILFHRMPLSAGGYFNSGDQYSVYQFPKSNESNLIYINSLYAEDEFLEGFVAHEFMHLITFGNKERKYQVTEDVWLNEARAEYLPTLLGYENGSRRINSFLRLPETSLTNWKGTTGNYGVVNLFVHYLVDHYGIEILSDSLKSKEVGIESINQALIKNGYSESFSDIFTDWTIAVLINDCSFGEKYCYSDINLRVAPLTNFLPIQYGSSYSARRSINQWGAVWQRIIGGKGDLLFEFEGDGSSNYRVPYLVCQDDDCTLDFLNLINSRGEVVLKDFGGERSSIIFIPSLHTDTVKEALFSWKISSDKNLSIDDNNLIESLKAQIIILQAEVERLRGLLLQGEIKIERDLSFGSSGDDVKSLQEFLKSQSGIYPQGLITGYFGSLTRSAVIRFQERYASEILNPLGLVSGTGIVGSMTRSKINQLK